MKKSIDAIRVLSIDMIEKANSGHPGICMGAAPMMYALYNKTMNIDPTDSKWFFRDRFILSAGHGSAMYYATLHLAGFDLMMDDLKQFRQVGSKTPGHPEVDHTDGIDATSGPLGQGIAQAVGLALAEKHLAAKYNTSEHTVIDNYTYALCGDGDLQEGVSSEACSIAGHLNLNKLIILWDANEIQLDAPTNIAISEDILKRYDSYGFNTLVVKDGEDLNEILTAITAAKNSDKPTLIKVNTVIGQGSPNKGGTPDCHGAPLGKDEIKLVKENYNWTDAEFEISSDVYADFATKLDSIKEVKENHAKVLESYCASNPKLGQELVDLINDEVDYDFELELQTKADEASRVSSGKMIQYINQKIPNLIGGSADLSKSNNSIINDSKIFGIDDYAQKNISYGVREFAMGAITNGIMLYGGLKAYAATFFVFSDYLKAAIRMSAIQHLPSTFVFTHDSIAVGEDGPTHEPIEQLSGLRAMPNLNVFRPCDANETMAAWKLAINSKSTPSALILTRQNLEVITDASVYQNVSLGGYVISDMADFEKVLIGTGSEVKLLIDVQAKLLEKGIKSRVVSMPCFELFDQQTQEYQASVLSDLCMKDRYFVEMASAQEGYKYARNVISINTFGMSGPAGEVIKEYGFDVDTIVNKII